MVQDEYIELQKSKEYEHQSAARSEQSAFQKVGLPG